MTCDDALLLISGHIDGVNTDAQELALRAHLAECAECRSVLAAFTAADQTTRSLTVDVPEGFKRGVMYRIAEETGTVKKRRRWLPGTMIGLAAAVALLLAGSRLFKNLPTRRSSDAAMPASIAEVEEKSAGAEEAFEYGAAYSGSEKPAEAAQDAPMMFAPEVDAPAAEEAGPAETIAGYDYAIPMPEPPPAESSYYHNGESADSSLHRAPQQDLTDETETRWADYAEEKQASVLVFSEFGPELIDLLQTYAAPLGDRLAGLPSEATEDGWRIYTADRETTLAVLEWLLGSLPTSEQMDEAAVASTTEIMTDLERIDPGQGSLRAVLGGEPQIQRIEWPQTWPEDWAVRVRLQENWARLLPAVDAEAPDAASYLVLPDTESP